MWLKTINCGLVVKCQGPVVQSILSLTNLLGGQFIKCFMASLLNTHTDVFC